MRDNALDNIDATIAALREVQDDENASPEAAEAARVAELALLKLLDVLLADARIAPLVPMPHWFLRNERDDDFHFRA